MIKINKEDLVYWLQKYSKTETDSQRETEQKLSKTFQESGFATKSEIIRLLHWKFENMKGRLKRELNLIEKETDESIIKKTKDAFQSEDDEEKIKILHSIKGFGNAVTSVALTFHNPNRYGVFDIHAWRELFGKESESKDYHTPKALLRFFKKLREISKETELSCREVEKAIFTKNYERK